MWLIVFVISFGNIWRIRYKWMTSVINIFSKNSHLHKLFSLIYQLWKAETLLPKNITPWMRHKVRKKIKNMLCYAENHNESNDTNNIYYYNLQNFQLIMWLILPTSYLIFFSTLQFISRHYLFNIYMFT